MKMLSEAPTIHSTASVADCDLGKKTEIGADETTKIAAATPRSSAGRPLRSSQSARTGGRETRTAPPQSPETKPGAPPGTTAGHSGSAGHDTMQEAGSGQTLSWFANKPLPVARQHMLAYVRGGQRMRCLKAFGERIAARHPYRRTAQIQIRVAPMNRFPAPGTPEIVRVT